jgi:tetratricopeptide (TPR) repeat protein
VGGHDEPRSFLFELAHFFARQGRSSLWTELVANSQQRSGRGCAPFDMNIALASVRYDLQRLASCEAALAECAEGSAASPPLFCFDEIDLLRPTEFEAHATLLAFLESLRGLTPLLFIGQQLPLAVDQAHHLSGLEICSMAEMLNRAQLTLEPSQLEQLQRQTQGNPRLLELFIELHRSGEGALAEVSDLFSGRQLSVEFLLRRIWRRLSSAEQEMLTFLVPFRRAVPRDAFDEPEEQAALKQLIERRLLQERSLGQIALLPAFRGVLQRWLSGETRHTSPVHLNAAMIRAKRGEYTAATYHCLQAGRAELAFRLWHSHQEEEINQGQAAIALNLFEGIADDQLSKRDQEALSLLRAELLKISGEYQRSKDIIRTIQWETPALKAKAKRIEGDIAELRDELDAAMNAYRAGLQTTEVLLSEKAQFHKNLGWVVMRQNELDDAWRQAQLADYEAENLKGYVQKQMGHYDKAREHYIKALTLAEQAEYGYGYANTCNNLGGMLSLQGEFGLAQEYLEKALHYFRHRGQLNKLASIRANQAAFYLLSRQHQAAIAPAQEALEIFERLGEPWGTSVARLNLAEAYLGVQAWDNAATCAEQLIQSEMRAAHYAWWVLGEVWLARHDYPQASDCLHQALQLAQTHQNRFLAGYVYRTQSKLCHAQGKPQAAQNAFEQAIELFEALNLPDEVTRTREECA